MVIFVHYTKLLAFVLALPNFLLHPNCLLLSWMLILNDSGNFFPLSASIPWVLVFELAMPVKKKLNTWDFRLGVFGACSWLFLFLLPIVNFGVKQINEAFESSLFCVLSSHIYGLITNYNFSWDFIIGFTETLREHEFMGFL